MPKVKEPEVGAMTTTNWVNIIILGAGFMLLFTAFQTTAFVQGVTISSFFSAACNPNQTENPDAPKNDRYIIDGGIRISETFSTRIGYISLCIVYLMMALGNWVSIPIVTIFGPKLSCVISGALYVVYIVALIRPYVPVIFLGAFILGSAGGVLWTAQGQILIQNSSKAKMGKTSGIFWFMLQNSLIIGNLFYYIYLYFRVKDLKCIGRRDNYIIFAIFTLLGVVGVIVLLFITPVNKKGLPTANPGSNINVDADRSTIDSSEKTSLLRGTTNLHVQHAGTLEKSWLSLGRAVRMIRSTDLLLLIMVFVYTGYGRNFWTGVYGPMIGHVATLKHADVGLAGLFIGLGEIAGGGLVFGILSRYTNRFGKDPVVLLGLLAHLIAFFLIFLNFPARSIGDPVTVDESFGVLFDPSNIYVAMVCAFLLGFGDACFNTQIYSIIGNLYPLDQDSAPAMALCKFFQSLAAMVGFVISIFILLRWQLLIMAVLGTLGTIGFAVVEWRHYKPSENKFI